MSLECLKHAFSVKPERPECNFFLSRYYSFRNDWMNAYIFACNGIVNKNNSKKFLNSDDYHNVYQFLFEKAYSGYNLGKLNESFKIYNDLLNNYPITQFYKNIIEKNLQIFPNKYLDLNGKIRRTLKYDENIYTIKNYNNEEHCKFKIYENCDISHCIRRGFRWGTTSTRFN